MKKIVGYVVLLGLVACGGEESSNANDSNAPSSIVAGDGSSNVTSDDVKTETSIQYVEEKHDFGDVRYPSENLHTFKFTNTGSIPLVIESAKASCGCTVPNKPEDPIMPGETGELDVIFRPKEGQQGTQVTKKVTVVANTNPAQTYLEITANVMPAMISE